MRQLDTQQRTAVHIAILSLLAVAFRVEPWLSRERITFDEGVFLASTDLARAGLTPFQDFFSSQGPLFIPSLRLGQILSGGDPRGARTILVLSGVVISISCYYVFTRLTTQNRAFLLASMVALSGTVLLAAGPVQSDGLALALALAALALVVNPEAPAPRAIWSGLLLGGALSVKSLHVLPIGLTLVAILVSRLAWRRLAIVLSVSGLTVLGLAAVYGLGAVWDQYVLFHLAKDNSPDLLDNLVDSTVVMFRSDLPVLGTILVAIGSPMLFKGVGNDPRSRDETIHDLPRWVPVFWLAATIGVLLGFTTISGGFARTLAFVVPAMLAMTALAHSVPIRMLLGIAVVGAIGQFATVDIMPELDPEEVGVTEQIASIPLGSWFVSDDPGLGWSAGRLSHPGVVDPSFARFQTGYLTSSDVDAALRHPETCIFSSTSGRFDLVGVSPPADYTVSQSPGTFVRTGC